MANDVMADIRIFAGPWPSNWLPCDGQWLNISQWTSLFGILGNTFGGDGQQTFALPDLRSVCMVATSSERQTVGMSGGETTHLLTVGEVPPHTHPFLACGYTQPPGLSPEGKYPSSCDSKPYVLDHGNSMQPSAPAGERHDNMSPYLPLNICICVQGIFPPTH